MKKRPRSLRIVSDYDDTCPAGRKTGKVQMRLLLRKLAVLMSAVLIICCCGRIGTPVYVLAQEGEDAGSASDSESREDAETGSDIETEKSEDGADAGNKAGSDTIGPDTPEVYSIDEEGNIIVNHVKYAVINENDEAYAEVIGLDDPAFSGEVAIETYVIRDGEQYVVKSIRDTAFAFSKITGVSIPHYLTRIGKSAFFYCEQLESISISSGVNYIEPGTFSYCNNLKKLSVNKTSDYFTVKDGVMYTADKKELVWASAAADSILSIPKGVVRIWDYAFEGNPTVESISTPKTLTDIGYGAFMDCAALKSVTIGRKVSEIDGNPFMYCHSLESIKVSSKNKTYYSTSGGLLLSKNKKQLISANAVKGRLELPTKVRYIEDYACTGNGNLTSIVIHSKVESIGDYAFCDCRSTEFVYFASYNTALEENGSVFANLPYYVQINLPYSSDTDKVNAYKKLLLSNSPAGAIVTSR